MKYSVMLLMLLLSGCGGRMLLLPNQQELRFSCDMDPYKQGCERRRDYDQHYNLQEKTKR
ncbi:hypothetical protein [Pseudomonas sp. PSKL.D1]|uniref:hypothetical protein n=1 Tax=Pseudomonas sp. PSKL.D1 TaxID=3029060 RepID=UPI0023815E50|nr:hypothetical protein [Pseudomonas sp. PSKL.D1]WDY58869.1 hypothetical protein PVV54_04325 [Pseudomonas sp. PSKL.D1]